MKIHEVPAPQSEDHAIVVVNHLGSAAAADTGRDAAFLAEALNLPTIAIDRPGSGTDIRPGLQKVLGADYVSEYVKAARKIGRELENRHIGHILVAGRSAGGSGALTLAQTEVLPTAGAAAFEPIGWSNMSVEAGQARYRKYLNTQQLVLRQIPESNRPEKPGLALGAAVVRALQIPFFAAVDIHNNKQLWADGQAAESARYIAAHMPDVFVDIRFAETSMAATYAERELAESMPALRKGRPGAAPFEVSVVPGTVHASFDNRSFMQEQLTDSVARLLKRN